ncbi:hypothetical protein KGQ27_01965 [Patescibacteria group bacterium]|nr:hypothetical protein [Patescibacteria group bacterium]MDE1946316.1 hypothetical protein [Patescibacteria group bacterium]MDE2010768.1 hypothetical protein [Patescibacteria group bacterium]MDE2232653.1 hypothetical protein [Patescibacteria group bacterium]
MKKNFRLAVSAIVVSIPFVVFAQTKTNTLSDLISLVTSYLNKILLLLMGFAVVLFVYYIIQYFLRPAEKRAEGAKYLMWSITGFFVILSFWGIVNVLQNTFNLNSNRPSSWSDFFNIFPTNTGTNTSGSSLYSGNQ